MNWYKKSQLVNDAAVANVLYIWLKQAQNGPVDISLVQNDLQQLMTIIDHNVISNALNQAVGKISSESDMLSEYQRNLINELGQNFK